MKRETRQPPLFHFVQVSLRPPTAKPAGAGRQAAGLISNRALLLAPDSLPLKVGKALCERAPTRPTRMYLVSLGFM